MALGMVTQLPDEDQVSLTKKQLLARLNVLMGGKAAEELIEGVEEVSTGASNDLEQATKLARAMVTKYVVGGVGVGGWVWGCGDGGVGWGGCVVCGKKGRGGDGNVCICACCTYMLCAYVCATLCVS